MKTRILKRFLLISLVVVMIFLHAVPAFADGAEEELYDVTTSSVMNDLQYLFDPPIDISVYSTRAKQAGAADYIDIVAFYSDAVFSEWGVSGVNRPITGHDYLYIYNSLGKKATGGYLYYADGSYETLVVSSRNIHSFVTDFFTKFVIDQPLRFYGNVQNSSYIPIKSIELFYNDRSRNSYELIDFRIDLTYTNQMDFEISKVDFSGTQKLDLDIGYTYWRSANFSEKGDGWHYQVDSIYFSIPNSIQDRLVDVELSYQQATTTPIVVTKTGEAVSDRFQEIALDPSFQLDYSVYSSRPINSSLPAFVSGSGDQSTYYQKNYVFSFNFADNSEFFSDIELPAVYWAFDVRDPSVISSGDLNSGELSNSRSTVFADRLEEWMLNYPLTGAMTTYTAANREGTGTQQVNGILFSEVQERMTKRASDLIGTTLPTFGDTHGFWDNLNTVGLAYAWAYLTGAARIDENGNEIPVDQINSVIHELKNYNDIRNKSDEYHFADSETANLMSACSRANWNNEKLYLVNFNVSDYYSHSFDRTNYNGSSFEGYLAIQDVYLDMQVLRLYFENSVGEVYPLDVISNHINGIADVTPAPEEEQLEEYAREALGWSSWDELLALLKKIFAVIVIILVVLLVIRIVFWFIQLRAQKKMLKSSLPPPERSQDPPPKRRRWRRSDRRSDRRNNRRWRH